ncbi:MAG: hypothetical protein ACJAYG_001593 [Oceanicoccus sp.]|jgi:hypothetical protein
MFKNKHLVSAFIVAPMLAIGAYFVTDYVVSEQPHKEQIGSSYPLLQLPNCRYPSGKCGLKNGNFKVVVTGRSDSSGELLLTVNSFFALESVYVSVVPDKDDVVGPTTMQPIDESNKQFQVALHADKPTEQFLRLVVNSGGAAYYAETAMPFLNYQTSFNKDFRK